MTFSPRPDAACKPRTLRVRTSAASARGKPGRKRRLILLPTVLRIWRPSLALDRCIDVEIMGFIAVSRLRYSDGRMSEHAARKPANAEPAREGARGGHALHLDAITHRFGDFCRDQRCAARHPWR